MSSKAYHRSDILLQIETEALSVIRERGDIVLSVRALSQKIGVSHNAIYHHFKSKQDLTDHLVMNCFKLFNSYLEQTNESEESNQIINYGLNYFKFCKENPGLYKFMFTHLGQVNESHYLDESKKAFTSLLNLVNQDRDQAIFLWATIHGLCNLLTENLISEFKINEKDIEKKIINILKFSI